MFKVHYHYKVDGIAKQFVAEVFMTLEEAREYILKKFDDNVEDRNEHDESSYLAEGHLAEICRHVIQKAYTIEYAAEA